MKFGTPPKKQWKSSQELKSPRTALGRSLNRLMVLDYVWEKLIGNKGRFWILEAVKKDTLYVRVKASVARSELTARKSQLIKELNKHFESPWIKKIEII